MLAPSPAREKFAKKPLHAFNSPRRSDTTAKGYAGWSPDVAAALKPEPSPAAQSVADQVNEELLRSRYPLSKIQCETVNESLILTGFTTQYYYVQVALEAALRHAGELPVGLNVEVMPKLIRPADLQPI